MSMTRELSWNVAIAWSDDHGPCTVNAKVWVPESGDALDAVARAAALRGVDLARAHYISVEHGNSERTIERGAA